MLALIFGIFYDTFVAVFTLICLDGIDVGNSDTNGDRRQQHEHNHQDYLHGTGSVCVEGLELMLRNRLQPNSLLPMPNVA